MRLTAVVAAAFLLVALPAAAESNTVEVPVGSADALGAAIATAGAGGTVVLGPGTHVVTESIVVDFAGVTVTASDGAILAGRAAAAGDRLVMFDVRADGFSLVGVEVAADPESIGDLACVVAGEVTGLAVEECTASGVVQFVDAGPASEVSVAENQVTTVEPTEADAPESHLVAIRAAGGGEVTIRKNRLEGVRAPGTAGIEALPPSDATHLVERNHVEAYVDGIYGEGAGIAKLHRNEVKRCTNGINVGDAVTAVGWEITSNRVVDVLAIGIYLADGDTCKVKKNRVSKAGSDGMNLGGVFLDIHRNRCRLNAGYGLFGDTDSCDYDHNSAKRNGNGIRVQGTGNRLHRNRGSKNKGDGVVSTGGNVNVEGNRGRKNGGVQVSIQ